MPARVFDCWSLADADRPHLEALTRHLATLERDGVIAGWHEGMVDVGHEIDAELERQLAAADVLVVSSDFLANDRCHALVRRALTSHDYRRLPRLYVVVPPLANAG